MRESGGSIPYGHYSITTLTILVIEIRTLNCIKKRTKWDLYSDCDRVRILEKNYLVISYNSYFILLFLFNSLLHILI